MSYEERVGTAATRRRQMLKSRFYVVRSEKGMKAQEVAAALGVTEMCVRSWESYRTYPRVETLISLAKLYGVSIDYLLGVE